MDPDRLLRLKLGHGRPTRLRMSTSGRQIIDPNLQMHLHDLFARPGWPHRSLVDIFDVEPESDTTGRIP